jgi:mRNA-degrading endonuclease RelE of RelBE toxin-antitoxin system
VKYRLLVDLEVIAVLDAMPKKERSRLLDHFTKLRAEPDQHAHQHERGIGGRRIEINVFGGYAIHYWIDFADRHVKILSLKAAR